jgi:hypothetical protein
VSRSSRYTATTEEHMDTSTVCKIKVQSGINGFTSAWMTEMCLFRVFWTATITFFHPREESDKGRQR